MITPPTDSLYKFIAISGLVILGWGVAFPWNSSIEYRLKVAETGLEIQKSKIKVDRLAELHQELLKEEAEARRDPASKDYRQHMTDIDGRKHKLYLEMVEAQTPVDASVEVLKVLERSLHTYYVMGLIGILMGGLLTVSGFLLWYQREQRYMDDKLRQEAAKAL